MPTLCFKCAKEIGPLPSGPVSRSAECPHCGAAVRCCRHCGHFDRSSYNECREPQADRVVDKERSNYCDYFRLVGAPVGAHSSAAEDARKKLDELFKKV